MFLEKNLKNKYFYIQQLFLKYIYCIIIKYNKKCGQETYNITEGTNFDGTIRRNFEFHKVIIVFKV